MSRFVEVGSLGVGSWEWVRWDWVRGNGFVGVGSWQWVRWAIKLVIVYFCNLMSR